MAKISGYAIITGSSRGIGKAAALQCAEEGYNVVLNYVSDRGAAVIDETLSEVKAKGVDAIVVRADVSTYEGCKKIIDSAVEAFGEDIEVLINNAGIIGDVALPFEQIDIEQMRKIIDTNLMSQFYITKLALPYMIKQNKGWIINIASNSGIMGVEGYLDYSASKGGVMSFSKGLAKEVAKYNIKVNAVAPGCFLTDILTDSGEENVERLRLVAPLQKLGQMEDIKLLVHYLINTEFIIGQVISPNGGWTI